MYKHVRSRLCAWLITSVALAAQADPLTLAAAQERVLREHPALPALDQEMGAQQALVRQAALLPNPALAAMVEDRERATRSTTITLTQPVEMGGKRAARVHAAERDLDLAAAGVQAKRADLRAATSGAFYALLAAQERLALSDAALTLAASAQSAAAGRVAAGKNSPVDETRARLAASGAELERMQARADLDQARETLAALWGGSADQVGQASGQLDQLPDSAPLALLLERAAQAPALVQARAELARRLASGRVEQARRMPDVAVTVGSKHEEQLGRRQAVFGVSLPLPLFDRNQGRIQEAMLRSEQARSELEAAKLRVASALRQAHARLTLARDQVHTLQRDILPAAHSTFEAARKGYDYGKFGILDVFDARRVLLQAQLQQLRLLADAHSAAVEIERLLGAPGAAPYQEQP